MTILRGQVEWRLAVIILHFDVFCVVLQQLCQLAHITIR
eukprot:CAMPEP_0182837060 /NCGR_PEP_ID=MMETSP0006_2-20121128/22469_1 /TAXON_ID=97485 /ORGANISM="Prymnesium parvum, Strain Texoma1" /LENGTH=38 /DNA_ID= /DNA_START= /DNA_END= /DNA_ORIENTATION=